MDCPICYDSLHLEEVVCTPCGHLFHEACLGTHIEQRASRSLNHDDDEGPTPDCPTCRAPIRQLSEEMMDEVIPHFIHRHIHPAIRRVYVSPPNYDGEGLQEIEHLREENETLKCKVSSRDGELHQNLRRLKDRVEAGNEEIMWLKDELDVEKEELRRLKDKVARRNEEIRRLKGKVKAANEEKKLLEDEVVAVYVGELPARDKASAARNIVKELTESLREEQQTQRALRDALAAYRTTTPNNSAPHFAFARPGVPGEGSIPMRTHGQMGYVQNESGSSAYGPYGTHPSIQRQLSAVPSGTSQPYQPYQPVYPPRGSGQPRSRIPHT